MFPQSELDNYKLQVELLQEKLQRSEISRKHLEQKLDKILQKRDEHDKLVRSKARQKYQQFLEEQQRRNERNKQLVQMLERIEQQTEAMNARSERLKMMKLQYEMYFAKLVQSQTKRCIQSSITPVTQNMPAPPPQPIPPTFQQPTMEGYNYVTNNQTPTTFIFNPYHQPSAATINLASDTFLKTQPENMPPKTMEIPTLANFARAERNDDIDFRNHNASPLTQTEQFYQQQIKYEPINSNLVIPTNMAYSKHEMSDNNLYSKVNAEEISHSSVTNLFPNDKLLTEIKENSNLSTTTSSTFEEISNVTMMSPKFHNLNEFPNTTTTIIKTNNTVTNNNNTSNNNTNFQTLQNTQDVIESLSKFRNQKDQDSTNDIQNINQKSNIVNSIPQDVENEIKNPIDQTVNELKGLDITMSKLQDKPLTSLVSESRKVALETPPNSINNTNFVNRPPEPAMQIESESLANNIALNSSTTPVSIENIENKIYGELLSPLENDELQKPENPNVITKLMENIITQPENIVNISSKEPTVVQESAPNTNSVKESTLEGEQNLVTPNYEQTAAYETYNTTQSTEDPANNFADYTNNSNGIDESQQQQYDYSNYDPTQYTYPGYIYDETIGDYKPDPNAPAEQYATNQQYTSEDYDQQYQQKDYDYNQTYAEDPTTSSTITENPLYNNYDTTQQEISLNVTPVDSNAENPETIAKPEPNDIQPDLAPEEIPTSSTKVTKPSSILSTADKNYSQKKKKRVNFIDSSETDESAAADKLAATKPTAANLGGSSESDFDFSSSTEAGEKDT